MSLKKYLEAIVASKEENEKSLAPARANEQKGVLGLEIAKLEVSIQGAENAVAQLASVYPLDIDSIVDASDELDLSKRRLEQLKTLSSELFS